MVPGAPAEAILLRAKYLKEEGFVNALMKGDPGGNPPEWIIVADDDNIASGTKLLNFKELVRPSPAPVAHIPPPSSVSQGYIMALKMFESCNLSGGNGLRETTNAKDGILSASASIVVRHRRDSPPPVCFSLSDIRSTVRMYT